LPDPILFQSFLENCKTLLWDWYQAKLMSSDQKDVQQVRTYAALARKFGSESDEITNQDAQEPLTTLMPLLIKQLGEYRGRVLAAPYYWSQHNPQYLSLVYRTTFPEKIDHDTLIDWADHYAERMRPPSQAFSIWLARSRKPAAPPSKKAPRAPKTKTGK